MDSERTGAAEAATHQPSKTELEEDMSIKATPETLAWAVTRGGQERRLGDDESSQNFLTPNDMLNELVRLGYIVPARDQEYQPTMPSAFEVVPNFTTADSFPLNMDSDGE